MTYVTALQNDHDWISQPVGLFFDINLIDNDKYLIGNGPRLFDDYMPRKYYDILNSDFSLLKRITIYTTGWGVLGINRFKLF